jgi:HK97 gp10 family phage protein
MSETKVRVDWFGDDLLAEIRGGSDDALFEAAQKILDIAQGNAPVRSGDLRDSGYVKTNKRSTYKAKKGHNKEREAPEGTALAGFAMFYAHMVERGTSKMAAQPYLRPAVDSASEAAGNQFVIVMASKLKGKRK